MGRIKVKYVAEIEINADIDKNMVSFDKTNIAFKEELTPLIQRFLDDEVAFDDAIKINVTQKECQVWME